jgi:hypothetical protein
MSILNTKISYYPGKIWLPTPLGEITLRQFIEAHKNPKDNIKEVFNKIAEAEKNEDWETKGKLKQENLYYFTPCVRLDGKGRSYCNVIGFTGILVLDFDHIKGDAEKFRDKLFDNLKSVICAYVSPSGKGIKGLLHIPKVNSVEEFKEYFYGIAYELEHMDSFDGSGQNPILPNFLSWDENIRWREDPETWTQRGGKHDEFEEYIGDFEEIENVTDEDKKEVLQKAHNIIKKADEENIGHPNCVSASLVLGGYIPSGYISYDEAENYLFQWIESSSYLSTKSDTYKKTAVTMLNKGMKAPLYLKKHQDKKPIELQEKEKNTKKRERKYYKLCNFSTFNLERTEGIVTFVK